MYHTLKEFGRVKQHEPLAKHTTYRIGGPAAWFLEVTSVDEVPRLCALLDAEGVPYKCIGGGSNMLAPDEGFDGVVFCIVDQTIEIDGTAVVMSAGAPTVTVARKTIAAGLTGFEWGVGVPGTIGGAIRGNAGATGGEMKDHLDWIEVYRDGEVIRIDAADAAFGYRTSLFKSTTDIILRGGMTLAQGADQEGLARALEYIQYRNATQPQGKPSSGCTFKNVEITPDTQIKRREEIPQAFLDQCRIPAGWLVQSCDLKGLVVGNAEVSERHGNFILNHGDASSKDIVSLIEQIKTAVYDTYGLELEEEIDTFGQT